jgi:hypothetical protein
VKPRGRRRRAAALLFGVISTDGTKYMMQKTWWIALSLATLLAVGLAPGAASFDGDCEKEDDSAVLADGDCNGDEDGECDGSCGEGDDSALLADGDCDGECDGDCCKDDDAEVLADCDGDCDGDCEKDDDSQLA